MYRISYEKCVCFIFLVILAVLSCSGFRIDNLAMTDISKRNSHTSSSLLNSDEFFNRFLSVNVTAPTFRHRIRHHRQLRAQAHTSRVLHSPTPQPNEHFAQIPSTDLHQNPLLPTRSIVRSQRSNESKRKKTTNACPEHDVSWKAYKSNTIVVAKVESKSSRCKENCTVLFKVVERLKNSSFPVDDRFRLKFSSDKTQNTICGEYDDLTNRIKIEQTKEYVLFLNTYGVHNFSAVFVPESRKKKTMDNIRRVLSPKFKPKTVRLEKKIDKRNSTRLRLACKVKGFPIPVIYWKRNNTYLSSNSHHRITQKKRKSTLVIRNLTEEDSGRYECVTNGVNGIEKSYAFQTVTRTTGQPCDEPMKSNFCIKGKCFYVKLMNEYACECDPGYTGQKCDQKLSDQSSMYRQTPIYTCKVGLYTKYDNC